MEKIAYAMKRSLVALNRLHEVASDPSTAKYHLDELVALGDNAIHAIMQSSDEIVEGMITKGYGPKGD